MGMGWDTITPHYVCALAGKYQFFLQFDMARIPPPLNSQISLKILSWRQPCPYAWIFVDYVLESFHLTLIAQCFDIDPLCVW